MSRSMWAGGRTDTKKLIVTIRFAKKSKEY